VLAIGLGSSAAAVALLAEANQKFAAAVALLTEAAQGQVAQIKQKPVEC
jgi:mevalonate kinase